MVVLDSSVLIDYLAGDDEVVSFVEAHAGDRLTTVPLVAFEVYQGEVFKSSPADFDELDARLRWLTVVRLSDEHPRRSAELQDRLHRAGAALSPRDAYIAGAAYARNEALAHRDSDFDSDVLAEEIELLPV